MTKVTRIKLDDEHVKAASSYVHGHNLNVLAFNLDAVFKRNEELGRQLMDIYAKLPLFVDEEKETEYKALEGLPGI